MTIPDAQTLMRPILAYLADGQAKSAKDVIAAMSDEFGLSDDERAQMLPSGRQRTMYDRVHWSLTHMSQAGLLDRPTRGHVQVTDTGRQVLKAHPERVDMAVLREFPSYIAFRERTKAKQPVDATAKRPSGDDVQVSPEDLIDAALAENRAAVEGEILKKALTLSPTGFEDLVIRLLEAMGYGRAGAVERTSDRGVYITTSSFSRGAREEAERINARIELIDGARLAELLVRYRVGVQAVQTVELLRLDEDFFDGL